MRRLGFKDDVDFAEERCPFQHLLQLPFFLRMRDGYRSARKAGWSAGCRSYITLLHNLAEIHEHSPQHANSYAKRLRTAGKDERNSEAIFAEVIVYWYYIRLVHEGLIRSIELRSSEADVIVVRLDGTRAYLEVLSVMPALKQPSKPGGIVWGYLETHTQESLAAIRQKLLHKIRKQCQMSTPRDNFAAIELNNPLIADDFTVFSSLSNGYKVRINPETGEITGGFYDWTTSIFDDDATRHLKGIIFFPMGNYNARKFIFNPRFEKGR